MRFWRQVLIWGSIHFALSVFLFLMDFRVTMMRFDHSRALSIFDEGIVWSAWAFRLPLVRLSFALSLNRFLPGVLGYIPVLLNSLLWGVGISWVGSRALAWHIFQ
jgi:hypothetical protein